MKISNIWQDFLIAGISSKDKFVVRKIVELCEKWRNEYCYFILEKADVESVFLNDYISKVKNEIKKV